MLSLKTHNALDYVIAALLIASPFYFGFFDLLEARYTFLVLGFGLAIYSMFTKYYYSIAGLLPLGLHMALDFLAGVALIFAPYVLGYRDELSGGQFLVHVVLGLGAMGLVAVTQTRTEKAKSVSQRQETSGSLFTNRRKHI